MTNTDKSRKEFEAWFMSSEDYRDGDLDTYLDDEDLYLNQDVQLDWNMWQSAWQASRAKPIKLPDEQGIPPTATTEQRHRRSGYNFAVHAAKQAIEAAGYRYE